MEKEVQYYPNKVREIWDPTGKTQQELCEASGLAYNTVNKIYRQVYKPAKRTKFRIVNTVNSLTGKNYSLEEIFPE